MKQEKWRWGTTRGLDGERGERVDCGWRLVGRIVGKIVRGGRLKRIRCISGSDKEVGRSGSLE